MSVGAQAAVRGWRNLPLVRDHDSRLTRWMMLLLGGFVVAVTPLVFYLVQQIEYVHVRYEIEELRSQTDRLAEAERRLRMERATLEALPRAEAFAVRAGLERPQPGRVLVVRRVPQGTRVRAPDEISPRVR